MDISYPYATIQFSVGFIYKQRKRLQSATDKNSSAVSSLTVNCSFIWKWRSKAIDTVVDFVVSAKL